MRKKLLILTIMIVATTLLVLAQSNDKGKAPLMYRPYTPKSSVTKLKLNNVKKESLTSLPIDKILVQVPEFKSKEKSARRINTNGINKIQGNAKQAKPGTKYTRPAGFFMNGLDIAGTGSYHAAGLAMLGAPFIETQWINRTEGADSYLWSFDGTFLQVGKPASTFTDQNPIDYYEVDVLYTPELKATVGGVDSIYSWGVVFGTGQSFAYLPGYFEGFDYTPSAGNLDLDSGLVAYHFKEGDYVFGTGPENEIDAVVNVFNKPLHRYLLDGVNVNVANFKVPADVTFELIIHRIDDEGNLTDTIATSAWNSGTGVNAPNYYAIMFEEFYMVDESGYEITTEMLEVEDAIAVEMKGFNNNPNITMACLSDYNSPSEESYAYMYALVNGERFFTRYKDFDNTLAFGLDMHYSYLVADDDKFEVPTNGGEKTFNLTSYFNVDAIESELPEWITDTWTFDNKTWEMTLTLKTEPLPEDIEGREYDVKLISYGADCSIKVTQGVVSELSTQKGIRTQVIITDNSFQLSYPQDFNTVSLYSLSGQQLASYQLPNLGEFSIPAGSMPKGIYMLKFSGISTETVKVVK